MLTWHHCLVNFLVQTQGHVPPRLETQSPSLDPILNLEAMSIKEGVLQTSTFLDLEPILNV